MSQLNLIIDTREHDVIKMMDNSEMINVAGDIIYDVKPLSVGDIWFQYENDPFPILVIERKQINDWVSSIRDGRTKNQTIRLKQLVTDSSHQTQVMYLLEGGKINKDQCFGNNKNAITQKTLYTSIIHKQIRDKFNIYRSTDVMDTVLIICELFKQIKQYIAPIANKLNNETPNLIATSMDYLDTIKLQPKQNMTPYMCYLCQLAQIPSVSVETAKVIGSKYKSMMDLLNSYNKLSSIQEKQLMLAELQLNSRKIGKVLSTKIYTYLCVTEENTNTNTGKLKLKLKST